LNPFRLFVTKAPALPVFTPNAVATPDPSPLTPDAMGSPVALVNVAADGVPRFGVVSVGDVARTALPVPVAAVAPVPPFATGRVPVTPVASGRPVRFVATPEAGVPSAGVTKVGLVARTIEPLPVGVAASAVAIPVPRPDTPVETGRPVAFVKMPLEGVPSAPPLTTKAPALPVLTPSAATTPVPVAIELGAEPAPPPTTMELAASAAEEAHADAPEK
jgi:hypothetical protein